MITTEFAKVLKILYWQSRKSKNWPRIKNLHEEEDKAYFKMLDEINYPARMENEKPPHEIEILYASLGIMAIKTQK